jgi:cytochrome b6-f complex iron-sulfur subunit
MFKDRISRRKFFNRLGWGAFVSTIGGLAAASARMLVPNVLYEPPKEFKVGYPKDFPQGVNFIAARRIFIIRENGSFRAVSAICTHLGCTIRWFAQDREFKCPCHGSVFNAKGGVVHGPAARPLPWYGVTLASDGRLLVDENAFVPPSHQYVVKV